MTVAVKIRCSQNQFRTKMAATNASVNVKLYIADSSAQILKIAMLKWLS